MDVLDAEIQGSLDGESDATLKMGRYTSYGMGLVDFGDEDDLADEARDAYAQGYESGYDLAGFLDDDRNDEGNDCWD